MSLSFPASPTIGTVYKQWTWDGNNWVATGPAQSPPPTTKIFTVGSGTYTTPANVAWIEMTIVGGGAGGGGGGNGAAGTVGGNTTFGGWVAGGGNGGFAGGGGAGGQPSGTTPTWAVAGGNGGAANNATSYACGAMGGNSTLGGAGGGGAPASGAGSFGQVNTGGGGGGGAAPTSAGINGGGGGGAGATVFVLITSPTVSYSYSVGSAGAGGSAGSGGGAGGNGSLGIIIVIEHYSGASTTAAAAPVIPKMLFGLELANNSSNPTTQIDITTGAATSDDDTTLMTLAATGGMTKIATGPWSPGSGGGALDSGSAMTASTWYHVYLIERTDTHAVDVLISTSVSTPTMPTSYSKKRRIGSIRADSGSRVVAFKQLGDQFLFTTTLPNDWASGPVLTTAQGCILSVPTGIQVIGLITANFYSASLGCAITVYSSDQTTGITSNMYNISSSTTAGGGADLQIRTDLTGRIYFISNAASGAVFNIFTRGWIDNLGK